MLQTNIYVIRFCTFFKQVSLVFFYSSFMLSDSSFNMLILISEHANSNKQT